MESGNGCLWQWTGSISLASRDMESVIQEVVVEETDMVSVVHHCRLQACAIVRRDCSRTLNARCMNNVWEGATKPGQGKLQLCICEGFSAIRCTSKLVCSQLILGEEIDTWIYLFMLDSRQWKICPSLSVYLVSKSSRKYLCTTYIYAILIYMKAQGT